MDDIQVTARCRIHEGKLAEFEAVARRCVQSVRDKDTGTRQYDWFFNAARTECVVREHYDSSEAVLAHIGNIGDLLGELTAVCDLSIEVFGRPSAALIEASAALPVEVYDFFDGLG